MYHILELNPFHLIFWTGFVVSRSPPIRIDITAILRRKMVVDAPKIAVTNVSLDKKIMHLVHIDDVSMTNNRLCYIFCFLTSSLLHKSLDSFFFYSE